MANIFQRVGRGVEAGLKAAQFVPDMGLVEEQIDAMIEAGELPTSPEEIDEWVEEKAVPRKRKSRLAVRRTSTDMAYASIYRYIGEFARHKDAIPEYNSLDRDHYLAKMWRTEPILAGAIYSMCAKMVSLKWQITGRRNLAMSSARMLSDAAHMGGHSWGGFNSVSALDFYTTDRGVFWEVARGGSPLYSRMVDIGHIDSLQCTLTGNTKYPVDYLSDMTGQHVRFRPGEVIHFASLPSSRESHLGIGFCAVSRALRAARLLMGLHNYDAEKLSNLPPEGVAAVTGLTMDEFQDALALWMASRKKAGSLTFPQVLWLIGSQPNAQVDINFVGFSQVPESFDRKVVVNQYVNTLALCFGVDAREFWPVSSGALGTAAETEVQHMKARGKGPGEYITATEREINLELPAGVEFRYDTQDIEEDMEAAAVAKAWVEAFFPMTTAGGAAEEILSKDELMRLLADKNVIPDWMVRDDRVVADDLGVEEKYWTHDDVICIEWDGRILRQKYNPAIDLSYKTVDRGGDFLEAEVLKGGPGSGHRGHSGRPGSVGGSVSGAGVGGVVPVKYGDIEVYSVGRGDILPKRVIKSDNILVALDSKGMLYATTSKTSHAEMASAMNVSAADFDRWIRGVKYRALGDVVVETVFAGRREELFSIYAAPGAADAEAMKNIKRLSRAMRNAGFPDNQDLRWSNTRGRDVTLPLGEWKEYGGDFLEAEVLKGGPCSGHRGHTGRPGQVGGSLLGTGIVSSERVAKIAKALKMAMPYDNRDDLDIPASGLPDARTKMGDFVDMIAYNPTTDDLLAGGGGVIHADMIAKYAPVAVYDDYVKVVYDRSTSVVIIDIGRVNAIDMADAWNKGFDTADALMRAGFLEDMAVKLRVPDKVQGRKGTAHMMTIGEMVKEIDADGRVVESTLGMMRVGRSRTSWQSVDAAVEFLKQAEATLEEEPKRNIRGNPVPKREALKGAKITKTAIQTEMELWRKHPLLSQYLPEGAGGS